jgi:hypothetical protein
MVTTNANGAPVLVIAVGFFNSTLFGVQYNGAYGDFVTSTDGGTTWADSGSSLPGSNGNILGMVFMANYAFVYTDSGKIFRATLNGTTFGAWLDKSAPPIPGGVQVMSRPDGLVAQGQYLFWGNYNLDTNPDQGNNQGAHLFRTVNGDSWSEVLALPHARHVHAIGVDPKNTQNIYVSVGDGGYGQIGLYLSTSNGDPGTFNQISANRYGIDFAFPDDYTVAWTTGAAKLAVTSSRVLLEGDRPPSMIESFDKSQLSLGCAPSCVTDSLITADDNPPDGVSWRGTSGGIKYTQEGNLFWISTGESGHAGLRSGVWMARGPSFTNWVLLEDLAPPILTASLASNCVATVTTLSPLKTSPVSNPPFGNTYVQPGTGIFLDGTTFSDLNAIQPGPIQSIDPAATTFQYQTPLGTLCNPVSNITGGVATIVTGWELYKTYETGDYLFNHYFRIKRPQFTGQKRGQKSW